MMIREVMEAVIAQLKGDATLVAQLGGDPHIYRNRSRATIITPSVVYAVLYNQVEENYAPVTFQFDVWGTSYEQAIELERSLYRILHSDLPQTIRGVKMWVVFQNAYDFLDEDQGNYRRAVIFRAVPPRQNG